MESAESAASGTLSWRLSSHPMTLLVLLAFRVGSLLIYLFGMLFTDNYVLIFILTMLLLSMDFYNLKNIAGRRLVGLRWWSEASPNSGDSTMVFESLDPNDPSARVINATDRRFFWLALYLSPVAWLVMGIVSIFKAHPYWLTLVAIALVLTVTNTVAFSRADKFSHASSLASSAMHSSNWAGIVASGVVGRLFG